jgi:hypothetical protein
MMDDDDGEGDQGIRRCKLKSQVVSPFLICEWFDINAEPLRISFTPENHKVVLNNIIIISSSNTIWICTKMERGQPLGVFVTHARELDVDVMVSTHSPAQNSALRLFVIVQ